MYIRPKNGKVGGSRSVLSPYHRNAHGFVANAAAEPVIAEKTVLVAPTTTATIRLVSLRQN